MAVGEGERGSSEAEAGAGVGRGQGRDLAFGWFRFKLMSGQEAEANKVRGLRWVQE